eukprot:COSAG02_NODE_6590_length_3473_cov_2.408000_3_plen_78_part_00
MKTLPGRGAIFFLCQPSEAFIASSVLCSVLGGLGDCATDSPGDANFGDALCNHRPSQRRRRKIGQRTDSSASGVCTC